VSPEALSELKFWAKDGHSAQANSCYLKMLPDPSVYFSDLVLRFSRVIFHYETRTDLGFDAGVVDGFARGVFDCLLQGHGAAWE
jgi:hypothetical protein